jgi:hypothetical protein
MLCRYSAGVKLTDNRESTQPCSPSGTLSSWRDCSNRRAGTTLREVAKFRSVEAYRTKT